MPKRVDGYAIVEVRLVLDVPGTIADRGKSVHSDIERATAYTRGAAAHWASTLSRREAIVSDAKVVNVYLVSQQLKADDIPPDGGAGCSEPDGGAALWMAGDDEHDPARRGLAFFGDKGGSFVFEDLAANMVAACTAAGEEWRRRP